MPSDYAFTINPLTRRLDMATRSGSPYYDESRLHKVMSRLVAHRGKWWADTTGARGSRLGEVKTLRGVTPDDLEAFAREALAPLVEAREILPPQGQDRIRVDVERFDRAQGAAVIVVGWSVPGGTDQTLRHPLRF